VGTFRIVRDGVQLTDGEIGSRKSRTLLKLLAVERPGLVTVDRIVEILWPDERPAAPEQNVATMVSRLRAVLGAELIQGGRTGYRLAADPDVVVDLDAAAGFCEQAEGKLGTAAAVALAAAERAHELLSAGTAISEEQYADWADRAREQLRELLRRVRLAAAEASLATGDPRTRRRPGAADTGAAPGHPARTGRRPRPERVRPGSTAGNGAAGNGATRNGAGHDPAGRAGSGDRRGPRPPGGDRG
jgi:DNA-binding SARP family transcriptional activator